VAITRSSTEDADSTGRPPDDYRAPADAAARRLRHTHPLGWVSRPEVPRDMARRLDHLADLAAAADVALEVNGSDVRMYPELVQLLCDSIARAGAPLSLGSDAHRPHSVGAVTGGIDAVRAAGLRSAVAFERRERRDYPL
jgi:histidinol phosphatase-like PHP family hydrolase